MPVTGAYRAHAVPDSHTVEPTRTPYRPEIHGEENRVTFAKDDNVRTRLHAWSLLREHELASGKVSVRIRQQCSQLNRKDVFAIKVLVQTVVVTFSVAKHEWCGAMLAGGVASAEIIRMLGRESLRDAQFFVPLVGGGH